MESFLKFLPVAAIFVATISLLYKAAESTPERNKQVRDWVVELLFFSFACLVLIWFVYQCVIFVISTAPLGRPEVALFALSLINVLLYGKLILSHIRNRASAPTKPDQERQQRDTVRLSEEVMQASEERLKAEMRANTAEQLRDFARELVASMKK